MSVLNSELKQGYFKYSINSKFTTRKMFFLMFIPIFKNGYQKLKQEAEKSGGMDWSVGMIERATMFGNGWIGVPSNQGKMEINEEFYAYKVVGKYSNLREGYQKVMKDYPNAQKFYNIYITDPDVTPEAENITYIVFN